MVPDAILNRHAAILEALRPDGIYIDDVRDGIRITFEISNHVIGVGTNAVIVKGMCFKFSYFSDDITCHSGPIYLSTFSKIPKSSKVAELTKTAKFVL